MLARSKQLQEKLFGSVRPFQVQRHTQAAAREPAPQLLPLDSDAAAIDLDDQATRSIGGIELSLQRRVDFLEELVDFLPPGDAQSALSQQRLRIVLESRGIALAEPIGAGVRFDAPDPRDRLVQSASRQTREVFQERALVPLLRAKQQGPFLELDENEGVDRRRQTCEHL